MVKSKPNIRSAKSQTTFEAISGSVEETQAVGERLGNILKPGDVVALHGELGSGKTTLIQGIARGLRIDPERVKSPTFVLMREYPGEPPVIHIDGYRLEGAPAVSWLDLDLVFSPHKVTLIEWAERFEGVLPEDRLSVSLEYVSTNRRRIRVAASGVRSAQILAELHAAPPVDVSSAPPTPQPELRNPNSDDGPAGD